MPKSIRLYLYSGFSEMEHVIYPQNATDEENAMVYIMKHNNACRICSEGNKLNTYVNEAVDVVWKLKHYAIN